MKDLGLRIASSSVYTIAECVRLEIRVVLRGHQEASGEGARGSPAVREPPPSSLGCTPGSGGTRTEIGRGSRMRRGRAGFDEYRVWGIIRSSNLGVLRSVRVLPEELEGRDWIRDGC